MMGEHMWKRRGRGAAPKCCARCMDGGKGDDGKGGGKGGGQDGRGQDGGAPPDRPRRVCVLPRLSLSDLMVVAPLVRRVAAVVPDTLVVAPRKYVHEARRLDFGAARFLFVDSWHSSWMDGTRGYDLAPLPSFRHACPYAMAGLDPTLPHTDLVVRRDVDAERALLHRVHAAVGERYVVVHDDEERRIRRRLLPQGLPVVHVRDPAFRTRTVFDWIQVMDHAVQVHAIDSCFAVLADLLALRPRTFVHAYAHPGSQCPRYRDAVCVF